jgi:hypothetical protein
MHIKLVHDGTSSQTGPIIYAYFEPGLVGLVFEQDHEGFEWGGRPDLDLPDLFWFAIEREGLVVNGAERPWELIA